MKLLIHAENLVKSFGKIEAIKGISINVYSGVTGLIGPNGAGKTTLINIIAGLIKTDKGDIQVLGFDPWNDGKKVRRKLGLLLEDIEMPKRLTGRRLIRFISEVYGTDYHSLLDLVEYFELEGALDREVGTYSAGMMKRLSLIIAFANPEAELIILDEPSANLDVGSRLKAIEFIKKVKTSKNILISSHILPELEEICDYIILINRGKIVDSNRISHFYATIETYEFIVITSDNKSFSKIIEDANTIDNYEFKHEKLIVTTKNPNKTVMELVRLASDNGIKLLEFRPKEDLLTRLFKEKVYKNDDYKAN